MKVTAVEASSDYENYSYGYQLIALPEPGESMSNFLNVGFMPARQDLSAFVMCRQVRVPLKGIVLSSENRRIMRKCEDIGYQLIPRDKFKYTSKWRKFCKRYTDARIGRKVVSYERLDSWFNSPAATHVMIFTNQKHESVGLVILYVESKSAVLYSRSFYDPEYFNRSLGMYQMLAIAVYFAKQNFKYIYLGTCYSQSALYKTNFKNAQFFNGFRWSDNMHELKHLLARDQSLVKEDLSLPSEFHKTYYTTRKDLFEATEVFWS